jgi:hypothetical protein
MTSTVIYNIGACWVAVKFQGRGFWVMYFGMLLSSIIPNWSLCAYFSRNLILDSFLFDMTLAISSIPIMAAMGQAKGFSATNWVGVVIALAGLAMIRIPPGSWKGLTQ